MDGVDKSLVYLHHSLSGNKAARVTLSSWYYHSLIKLCPHPTHWLKAVLICNLIIYMQKIYTEKDIMSLLPDKRMTLDIMVITKLLSSRGTNSLGNFEMQYLYDPVGVKAAEE